MFEIFPDQREYDFTPEAFQTLFWLGDLMPGGLFLYRADDSQEILYANRATLQIFGCETCEQFGELTGFSFRGLVHPEEYEQIQDSINRQITDSGSERLDYVKYRIIRRDGEIRWITDFGRLAHITGYGDVYIVFITDATERQRARDEQRRMELELAHERQANEIKSSFLFNMSHDIRTPMNAIIGFSELARRHKDEPDKLDGYLDKTVASGQQLLRLIDDMLELNVLEGSGVALRSEPTDIAEQIELALDMFRIPAAAKQLTLTQDVELPPDPVLTDRGRILRILSNLLDNAVKFTRPGGCVSVTARRGEVSAAGYARFVITVRDTGIGISEDFLPRIYNSFERESCSTVSGNTGTGLGLSIVKSLLDLMGGTISVESRKSIGSAFTVELPLRLVSAEVSPAPAPAADTPAPQPERQLRLLLVEDIDFNRELAETLLEESGFLVESVPDGVDAVEAVKSHPAGYYDFILMDIQMPIMNGYDATRAIRALPWADAETLPIIALSANSQDEDRRKSMACGMNCHVAKPFDIDALVDTIHSFVRCRKETEKA